MLNGSGIRVTLWVAGCTHHCKNCQNPITWNSDGGIIFDDKAMNEILEALNHDYISGLTLSGGDPLYPNNRNEILNICKVVKQNFPQKNIWMYTGYTFEEICEQYCNERIYGLIGGNIIEYTNWEWLEYVDVLVDGPYIEEQRDIMLPFRGSRNQRLIDVKETLKQGQIVQYKIN